ncbi:hypothetical protein CYY_008716 [Polysphondylium violaceum]|uniref:VWFA domain-containing protein n=1 Tax=Polysphondylium violaceum TaxID=133409 RepID=A0A8J4PNX1_9MYCE|nr:hypothetical protein CYY_008716 [Polysphondylium violaceum]
MAVDQTHYKELNHFKVNISPSLIDKMKKEKRVIILIESTKHMDPYVSMIKEIVKYLFNTLENQTIHIITFDDDYKLVEGLDTPDYFKALDQIQCFMDKENSMEGFNKALVKVLEMTMNEKSSHLIVFGKGNWVAQNEQDFENPVFESILNNALSLEKNNQFVTFLLGKDTNQKEIRDLFSKSYFNIYKIESDFYQEIKRLFNQSSCPAYVQATPADCIIRDISLKLKIEMFPRNNLEIFNNVTFKHAHESGSISQETSSHDVTFTEPFTVSIDTGLKAPKRISFSIIINGQEFNGEIEPHISWFLRNIKFSQLVYTIAFAGTRGVGKSSSINSLLNLFSCQNQIFEKNVAGFLNDHVTLEINKTKVSQVLDWFDHPLVEQLYQLIGSMIIYDIPGHEVGRSRVDVQSIQIEQLVDQFKPDTILIPFSLQNEDELDIKYINSIVELLRERDISPILILTFADNLSPTDLSNRKSFLMHKLNFDSKDVFQLINYAEETVRNFDKDVSIFNIFSRAIENSQICKNKKRINNKNNN